MSLLYSMLCNHCLHELNGCFLFRQLDFLYSTRWQYSLSSSNGHRSHTQQRDIFWACSLVFPRVAHIVIARFYATEVNLGYRGFFLYMCSPTYLYSFTVLCQNVCWTVRLLCGVFCFIKKAILVSGCSTGKNYLQYCTAFLLPFVHLCGGRLSQVISQI